MAQPLYIFLDEGGNFDFSVKGTHYFTFTSIAVSRPFPLNNQIASLRFDLIEQGYNLEYFHASENKQVVRDAVFALIRQDLNNLHADSLVIEKCKTGPALRPIEKFYPKMLGYLLRYVLKNRLDTDKHSEVIVISDRIPVNRKRNAVEKAVKLTMSEILSSGIRYRLLYHDSKSAALLQVADYIINWAIYRKWNSDDHRSYQIISSAIRSEFDIFRLGKLKWY